MPFRQDCSSSRGFVVEEGLHKLYAHYVDASSGELLRSEALFSQVQARVFDINPVAKLNRPDLADNNNVATAVPNEAYSIVDLDNLAPSGPLAGPYVTIVNLDNPVTTPADASQSLLFDRSQPQFEEVNAYFQLDRAQKYLLALGYTGSRRLINYQLPCDPHALNGGVRFPDRANCSSGTVGRMTRRTATSSCTSSGMSFRIGLRRRRSQGRHPLRRLPSAKVLPTTGRSRRPTPRLPQRDAIRFASRIGTHAVEATIPRNVAATRRVPTAFAGSTAPKRWRTSSRATTPAPST